MYTTHDNPGLVKVLQFLKSHKLEYLSGEDLSEVLKISRVAVWKHIKKIQTLGYKIESKQNLGYRLTGATELMLPWEITEGLRTKHLGKKAYYFDSIESTQNFAVALSKKSDEVGSIVIARSQTAGRGRLGRVWVSPKGGIWLSVVLHPTLDVAKITLVPLASAVALSNAVYRLLNIKTELKWPNDVTLDGKKVAGMVVDATVESSRLESLVLGVGINFKVNPTEIEKKIKTQHSYGVETLLKKDSKTRPAELVQAFLEELEKTLNTLVRDGPIPVISQWTKKSSTIGKKVIINSHDEKISGKALRLDNDGSLIVRSGPGEVKITSGDVGY